MNETIPTQTISSMPSHSFIPLALSRYDVIISFFNQDRAHTFQTGPSKHPTDTTSHPIPSNTMSTTIFPPFNPQTTWRAVDDRVRGGSSHSYLEQYCKLVSGNSHGTRSDVEDDEEKIGLECCGCVKDGECGVRFYGTLGKSSQLFSFRSLVNFRNENTN
jgi:hypothetical protein